MSLARAIQLVFGTGVTCNSAALLFRKKTVKDFFPCRNMIYFRKNYWIDHFFYVDGHTSFALCAAMYKSRRLRCCAAPVIAA